MKPQIGFLRGLTAVLAFGCLAACDTGPTEPRAQSPAQAAVAFGQLVAGETEQHGSQGTACPEGGHVYVDRAVSIEKDGAMTIRRHESTAVYENCSMDVGWATMTADGELTWSGVMHLAAEWSEGDAWRRELVLFDSGRQTGVLRMERNGEEIQNCEYDLEWINQPAAGRFSQKGTACGVTIDRRRS